MFTTNVPTVSTMTARDRSPGEPFVAAGDREADTFSAALLAASRGVGGDDIMGELLGEEREDLTGEGVDLLCDGDCDGD